MATENTPLQDAAQAPAPINVDEVEARAKAIVEERLAQDRAKDIMKEVRNEGENLLERAADGVAAKASNAAASIKAWRKERAEIRREQEERDRAAEIAKERLIREHMDEARRQLEQERLEAELANKHDS